MTPETTTETVIVPRNQVWGDDSPLSRVFRTSPAPSVGLAAHFPPPVGVLDDVLEAFGAVRARPLARRVPGPALAGLDLCPVTGIREVNKGIAPARRPGVVNVTIVGKRPFQINRRPETGSSDHCSCSKNFYGIACVRCQTADSCGLGCHGLCGKYPYIAECCSRADRLSIRPLHVKINSAAAAYIRSHITANGRNSQHYCRNSGRIFLQGLGSEGCNRWIHFALTAWAGTGPCIAQNGPVHLRYGRHSQKRQQQEDR